MSTKSFFALVFVVGLTSTAFGIDTRSLYEQKCFQTPPPPVKLDMEWASQVGSWYMSAASRLHAYRTASEVAGVKETDLVPHDLYYKACIRFVWGADTLVTGFGNKQVNVGLRPTDDGTGFNFRYSSLGLDGKATVVLTDNKSFMVHYVCWPQQNQASYAIISSVPVLPEKIKKVIVKKIMDLGFSEKQFTLLRCASCITLDE